MAFLGIFPVLVGMYLFFNVPVSPSGFPLSPKKIHKSVDHKTCLISYKRLY